MALSFQLLFAMRTVGMRHLSLYCLSPGSGLTYGQMQPCILAICLAILGFAAGLNTAITRTPLATTHILSILCGQSNVTVPCLAAALTALYLTSPFPFIMSQRDRQDVHLKVQPCVELVTQKLRGLNIVKPSLCCRGSS